MGDENNFDLDAGVAQIADSLGVGSDQDHEFEDDTSTTNDYDDGASNNESDNLKTAEEKTAEQQALKPPPQSWAKEKHEIWGKLDPQAQEYIELREKQMLDGIEQYKGGYQYAQAINQAIEPFRQDIAAAGVDEATAISELMRHHRALTNGTLEQRQQALLQIGIASGIIPRDGQSQADLERMQLERQIQQYQQLEQGRIQQYYQQEQQRITQAVTAFATDPKNEYFEEVADTMLPLLQAGHDLQSAYDQAVWANPVTRAKEIAKQQTQSSSAKTDKSRLEAEAARKASSVNVKSTSGRNGRQTQPTGSMRDTMEETLREMKNRA